MLEYRLKLYVTGNGPRSQRAIRGVQRMCEDHLEGRCQLSIVDVCQHPELAEQDGILATPTLVRDHPTPPRRVVGDLTDFHQVEASLGLAVRTAPRTRASHS